MSLKNHQSKTKVKVVANIGIEIRIVTFEEK